MDNVIAAFQALSNDPMVDVVSKVMPINIFERYVTMMYDRTSTCRKVNDAWKDLFTRKGRHTVAIYPTSDALLRSPVERDTTQDSTNMSKRQNLDVFNGSENLFRGNKSRKKLLQRLDLALCSAFWLGRAFRNCSLYCVFFPYSSATVFTGFNRMVGKHLLPYICLTLLLLGFTAIETSENLPRK